MYSTAADYLLAGSGALGHQNLSTPSRLIRRIDTHGIVLSEPKDELAAQYTEPPSIFTMVENRLAPGPHRDTLPQADEVRVAHGGYDGTLMVVDRIELSSIAERLSVGLAVYAVDGVQLGDVTQCDTECCLLMLEKGIF